MKAKVSIIVPVYNVENYLEKCIKSILSQTYHNLQIILINDGSTDSSGAICDKFRKLDKRVIVIHTKNNGVSAARNAGLKKIDGDYVMFIDSDDYIEPTMVEKMLYASEKNDAEIVCCNYFVEINEQDRTKADVNSITNVKKNEYIYELTNENGISGYLWNKLYKKNTLKNNYKFEQFDEKIKIMEDLLFNLKILKNIKKVTFIDDTLYHYVQRENSALNTKNILKMKSSLSVYPKIIDELKKNEFKNTAKYKLSYIIEGNIIKIYSQKNYTKEIAERMNIYIKENLFLNKGNRKLKLKAITLIYFPCIYKIFRKIKEMIQ